MTMNGTQSRNCSILGSSKAWKIGFTFAWCLLLVVSLAGNSLIAIIVYKTKPMRKTIYYLIVNMAMSDLLFPVFILPLKLIELYGGLGVFIGHLGQVFCKVQMFLHYFSCCVSVESLLLITVDRFVAVVFPLRAPLVSSKLSPFFILATWFVSTALCCPVLFAYNPVEYPRKMKCEWRWKDTFVAYYSIVIPIAVCAICFPLIIIFYAIIVFKLKSQKIPGEQSVSAEEKRVKMHGNVFKMARAIVIGFVLCWGPSSVALFLYVFVWDNTTRLSCEVVLFWFVASLLTYMNCAVNALICFTYSGNYRQGLKGILGCC